MADLKQIQETDKTGASLFGCHKIAGGYALAEVMVAKKDGICFYLVDPQTGVIIEKNHELEGQSIANKVLVFPGGKGSSVVQLDGLFQLTMQKNAPKAMIIQHPDTVLVASAIIMEIPLVDRVEQGFYDKVQTGMQVEVDSNAGTIRIEE